MKEKQRQEEKARSEEEERLKQVGALSVLAVLSGVACGNKLHKCIYSYFGKERQCAPYSSDI